MYLTFINARLLPIEPVFSCRSKSLTANCPIEMANYEIRQSHEPTRYRKALNGVKVI